MVEMLMKQMSFSQQNFLSPKLKSEFAPSKEFGGSLLRGKRKTKRPLNFKLPIHTVLRCSTLRSGSLLWNADKVTDTLEKFAAKFGVKIYEKAIVSNHVHLILKFRSRQSYNSFVRAFAGVLAKTLDVIWAARPWTRVLQWGRDFRNACAYTFQNRREAAREIPYKPRQRLNLSNIGRYRPHLRHPNPLLFAKQQITE